MNLQRTYRKSFRVPLIAICIVALIMLGFSVILTAHNVFIAVLMSFWILLTFSFGTYLAWWAIRRIQLTLSPDGLRYASIYGEYFVPWKEVSILKINKNRKGKVKSIIGKSSKGRRINISQYDHMDEITKYIQNNATQLEMANPVEIVFFNKYVSGFLGIISIVGWVLILWSKSSSLEKTMGFGLIVISLLPYVWINRTNLIATITNSKAWKYWGKYILISLAFSFGVALLTALIIFIKVLLK